MMTALQTIAVAFAMFSALPMPQFDWNAKNMRYALCAFPLVGAVCGALWCLCGMLPLPALARAAGLVAEPLCVAVTGTIWRTIIETADQIHADVLVTGTRGTTGLRSLMQSSVADRVLRHGKRPVLIVPPGPPTP